MFSSLVAFGTEQKHRWIESAFLKLHLDCMINPTTSNGAGTTMTEKAKMAAVEEMAVGFLGVTTRFSAVHRVFDRWSDCLGHRLVLRPMDLPLKSNPGAYRSFVADIRKGRDNLQGGVI